MKKGQKSKRNGIEDFLCPFTDMYITQGSNSRPSHMGIMANDVRGKQAGVRYPYYAPCTCKCLRTYPSSGQAMWQSTAKVRFANGRVDYATFMTVHDNTFDAKVGMVVPQGNQLGNMGTKGNATGVHCHIEVSQSANTSWTKNKYGVWHFQNEYDLDDCYFVDNTNILNGMGGHWRKTSQVPVAKPTPANTKNYVNLPANVDKWNVYKLSATPVKKNAIGSLNPKKYGGLSYYVYRYLDNKATAEIQTSKYGRVKIYIKGTPAKITIDKHTYNKGSF